MSKVENIIENNNYCTNKTSLLHPTLTKPRNESFIRSSLTRADSYDYQLRVIIVGDSTVGKTSLLRCLTKSTFKSGEDATVGVDFVSRNLKVGGEKVKLHLWDTAGQERFRFLCQSYYRNSVGVVVAFSLLSRPSFDMVETWVQEARQYAGVVQPSVMIVGCKLDLVDVGCRREISEEEAKEKAAFLGAKYSETSAKQGIGVEETFRLLCEDILIRLGTGDIVLSEKTDSIKVSERYRSGSLCWNIDREEKRNSCCF